MSINNGLAGPPIGVIGGSGFYTWMGGGAGASSVQLDTPYGSPSAPLTTGVIGGREVVFIPRHGVSHEYLPHQIPYRANMWALQALGVRQVISASAVGSLQARNGPGTVVVPDQFVDRTSGRTQTYFDEVPDRDAAPAPVHVSMADPYCPQLRGAMARASADVVDSGVLAVIDGPRFSTRAESRWYSDQGWSVINMTGHPEAVLARELKMCFATACLVTDVDAGVAEGDGVRADDVFAEFAKNLPRFAEILAAAIAAVDPNGDCGCAAADHELPRQAQGVA